MNNKNCPNCGAPYDIELTKCPYCGTSYFDLSSINFDKQEPFYLKIKINGMTLTQLVKPSICSINTSADIVDVNNNRGQKVATFTTALSVNYDLSFQAVNQKNKKELITVTYN